MKVTADPCLGQHSSSATRMPHPLASHLASMGLSVWAKTKLNHIGDNGQPWRRPLVISTGGD
eukprot:11884060-Prorocentrum_lima.AAC.1